MTAREFICDLPLDITVNVEDGEIASVDMRRGKKKALVCRVNSDADIAKQVFEWLDAYTRRVQPKIALPLKLPEKGFSRNVLENLRKIPFGKTQSYKEIAESTGVPKGARAVGGACGANPFPLFIPCHRVLRTDGEIGGFSAGGPEVKKMLLSFEKKK